MDTLRKRTEETLRDWAGSWADSSANLASFLIGQHRREPLSDSRGSTWAPLTSSGGLGIISEIV